MTDNYCNPLRLADWTTWQNSMPVDPLDLIANAMLQSGAGIDGGVYLNSASFATPTPMAYPTPVIVAVDLMNTFSGKVLAQMPVPIVTLSVYSGDGANAIDVTFNDPPDPSSVTSSSFKITVSSSPVSGTLSFITSTKVRFTASSPFVSGDTYTVTLFGIGPSYITFGGGTSKLDGIPYELPSGNGGAGSNFMFQFTVSSSPVVYYPGADVGGWNPTLFALSSAPVCSALGSDNFQNDANASQWNFSRETANLATNPALLNTVFLRGGTQWQMTLPLNLGTLSYPTLQLSFRNNAGTRGDCSRTYPVISFSQRNYTGGVSLLLTLKQFGSYMMGLRAIDARGNYFMYETTWEIVA